MTRSHITQLIGLVSSTATGLAPCQVQAEIKITKDIAP